MQAIFRLPRMDRRKHTLVRSTKPALRQCVRFLCEHWRTASPAVNSTDCCAFHIATQKVLKKHDPKLEAYWSCLADTLEAVRALDSSSQ